MTKFIIVGAIFLLLGWEVYTLVSPEKTISEVIWEVSSYPLVPFVAGMLMGHWFWPKGNK